MKAVDNGTVESITVPHLSCQFSHPHPPMKLPNKKRLDLKTKTKQNKRETDSCRFQLRKGDRGRKRGGTVTRQERNGWVRGEGAWGGVGWGRGIIVMSHTVKDATTEIILIL